MPGIKDKFIDELKKIVGTEGLLASERLAAMDPGFHPDNLGAGVAVSPASTAEVARILTLCHHHGIGVVPHGGRTGLAGGAASRPGAIILMMTALNRVIEIDPDSAVAVVDAGVTLQTLDEAAAGWDLSAGIDIAARGSATIGGMVSTNAGGGEAFRHGIMQHRVLGLEAVLADGTIVTDLKKVTKANEGMDVKQLFIGAEGTLGVITRAVLRLENRDGERTTALIGCHTAAAATRLFADLSNLPQLTLLSAEIMWRDYATTAAGDLGLEPVIAFTDCPVYVLFDVCLLDIGGSDPGPLTHVLMQAMESELITDAIVAKNERERADMWRIREDSWAIDRQYPHGLWYDVSVPQASLDDYVIGMIKRVQSVNPGLKIFVMGHLGDGNLHLTISCGRPLQADYEQIAEAVYDGLSEMGGSFSAEHGIGLEKKNALRRLVDPGKQQVMAAIKQTLDPRGIMNPGKAVP